MDKFIFRTDFAMLDIDEDQDVPLILDRPFLATGKVLMDVQKGGCSEDPSTCFRVDIIEQYE